jgi:hypothetical protein
MEEHIFDGKPHALNSVFGYLTLKIDESSTFLQIEELKTLLIKEYIKYLLKFDEEKCLDIILRHFCFNYDHSDFTVIHRPAWISSALSQYATISLKFKRVRNQDGLENE